MKTRADYLFYYLTDYTTLLSLLRHCIQNIVQNYNNTEREAMQRNRNTKNKNTERRKPSFTKRIGRKCWLL